MTGGDLYNLKNTLQEMATELGLPYYETSAATGEGEQINIYSSQAKPSPSSAG